MHRGWVGIIGIHNQVVLLSDGHLTAIVCRLVFLKGSTNLLAINAKVDAYSDGSQEVVNIIRANELGLNLVPLGATPFLLECHQWLAPTELQEGIA